MSFCWTQPPKCIHFNGEIDPARGSPQCPSAGLNLQNASTSIKLEEIDPARGSSQCPSAGLSLQNASTLIKPGEIDPARGLITMSFCSPCWAPPRFSPSQKTRPARTGPQPHSMQPCVANARADRCPARRTSCGWGSSARQSWLCQSSKNLASHPKNKTRSTCTDTHPARPGAVRFRVRGVFFAVR